MKSSAAMPDATVKSLPADRREAIRQVRAVLLRNLPKGYEEIVDCGMLAYVVPLAAPASQKQYMSVYLMCIYGDRKSRS